MSLYSQPDEILKLIFSHLDVLDDLPRVTLTCQKFRDIIKRHVEYLRCCPTFNMSVFWMARSISDNSKQIVHFQVRGKRELLKLKFNKDAQKNMSRFIDGMLSSSISNEGRFLEKEAWLEYCHGILLMRVGGDHRFELMLKDVELIERIQLLSS